MPTPSGHHLLSHFPLSFRGSHLTTQVQALAPPRLLLLTDSHHVLLHAEPDLGPRPLLMRSPFLKSPSAMVPGSLCRCTQYYTFSWYYTQGKLNTLLFSRCGTHLADSCPLLKLFFYSEAAIQIYPPSHQIHVLCLLKTYSFFLVFSAEMFASVLCPSSVVL